MPTISQLIGSERKRLTRKTKSPALKACPERRGVCTRVYTSTPKKLKEEGYVREFIHQHLKNLIQL